MKRWCKLTLVVRVMVVFILGGQLFAQGESAPPRVIETPFTDSFANPSPAQSDIPQGWKNWKTAGDDGIMFYDKTFGRNDKFSIGFENSRSACWVTTISAKSGATYRLSGYVKAESQNNGQVAIMLDPNIIDKITGKSRALFSQRTINTQNAPNDWTYFEIIYQTPLSGNYPEGKLDTINLYCYVRNILQGKVWFDDFKLDVIEITAPWVANFTDKTKTLNEYQSYAAGQIEGITKLTFVDDGYNDVGALAVEYVSGKSGYAAIPKTPILCKNMDKDKYWTLVAHVRSIGDAKPALAVEQLNAVNGVIRTINNNLFPAKNSAWQEISLPFTIGDDAVAIRPLLLNNNQGQAIFDNVYLRHATRSEQALCIANIKKPIIWMNIYPADFYAFIDDKPSALTLPSGQAIAFYIQLAGDKKAAGDTVVEVEMPNSINLLAADLGVWGAASIPFTQKPSTQADCTTYCLKNPYDWQRLMIGDSPNYYTGLMLTVKANVESNTQGKIIIKTKLGSIAGETREEPFVVRASLPKVPKLNYFCVGIYDLSAINSRDDNARKELYQTYMDAGVMVGSIHESQGFAVESIKASGFTPTVIISSQVYANVYNTLPADKRPAKMVLADGRESGDSIALGLALGDEVTINAYKNYLKGKIALLPEAADYAVIDIEFWGDGLCSNSCFHPSTLAEFRKYAKIPGNVELNAACIAKSYGKAWSDFRNYATGKLHGNVRDYLKEIKPAMQLLAYDYTLELNGKPQKFVDNAPMNTLIMDEYIDIHLISYYNYEGTLFLDHIDNDVKHLKKPVWAVPYISEAIEPARSPNWSYHHPSAGELRLEVLGAAASGARGFLPFAGKLLDADRLQAIADGVTAVARYQDFYAMGKRVDEQVQLINPPSAIRYRVHELSDKTLLTVLNCGDNKVTVNYKFNNAVNSLMVDGHDFKAIIISR